MHLQNLSIYQKTSIAHDIFSLVFKLFHKKTNIREWHISKWDINEYWHLLYLHYALVNICIHQLHKDVTRPVLEDGHCLEDGYRLGRVRTKTEEDQRWCQLWNKSHILLTSWPTCLYHELIQRALWWSWQKGGSNYPEELNFPSSASSHYRWWT